MKKLTVIRCLTLAILLTCVFPVWSVGQDSGTDHYIVNRTVNIKNFGCVGDGKADDSAGLIAAFAAVQANGVIRIPPGEYIFDSDVATATRLEIPQSNVSIVGDGPNVSTIKVRGAKETGLIVSRNKSNLLVQGVKFTGNNAASQFSHYGTAIWISYTDDQVAAGDGNIFIQDCNFENFRGPYWVSIQNSRTVATSVVEGVGFKNLYFRGGGDINPGNLGVASRQLGAHSTAGGKVRSVSVVGCYHDAFHVKQGIGFQGNVHEISIRDCEVHRAGMQDAIDNTGRYGVMVYNGDNFSIEGCRISESHDAGIYILNATTARISNNLITGVPGRLDGTLPKGALVLNAATANVSGNVFQGNAYNIAMTASNKLVTPFVSGNTFDSGIIKVFAPIDSGHDNVGGGIIGNSFQNSGILFRSGLNQNKYWSGFKITDNTFLATGESPPFVTGDLYQGFPNLEISNNTMFKTPTASITHAIRGNGGPAFARGLIVKRNRISGTFQDYSASFYQVKDITLSENLFEDSDPQTDKSILYLIGAEGVRLRNGFLRSNLNKIGF